MNLVLQNPLVRVLRTYGWAPLLICVSIAMALGGFHALTAVGVVVGVLGGMAAGVLVTGASRVKRAREALEASRQAQGLLFVCPQCLVADTPRRACPACSHPLPVEQSVTNGEVVGYCPECRRTVTPEALSQAPAACGNCGQVDSGDAWMKQKTRVVGTLSEVDFITAADAAGGTVQVDRGLRYARADTPQESLFLLCLADLANSRAELPPGHAASHLSSVWVDHVDALAGTEALDRLAQRTGLSPTALKRIQVCVSGAALDPAAERAFGARVGATTFQVPAPAFLGRTETLRSSQPPTAATQPEEVRS